MNIWKIQQELLSIFDELEENGGELTKELEQQLAISQEDFRSKVENYTNVIKSVKADIAAIDEETKRLATLKKSKNALIDRLSKVIINAVEMFGETTKTGGKFFDYGTGKISVRNSQKVVLDDDKIEAISGELCRAIASEAMMGNASNREDFTFEDIIQRCKKHVKYDNNGNLETQSYDVTKEDIKNTVVEITFKEHVQDLMKGDGFNILKQLFMYNNGTSIIPKIDKTQLKNEMKDTDDITIGEIVDNQTLVIK